MSPSTKRLTASAAPRRTPRAFTLIELLVVISIYAAAFAALVGAVGFTREAVRTELVKSDLGLLRFAAAQFWDGRGRFPSGQELEEFRLQRPNEVILPSDIVWDAEAQEFRHESRGRCYRIEVATADELLICSYPKDPFDYSAAVVCIDENGQFSNGPPSAAALAANEADFQAARLRLWRGSAEIISQADSEDAQLILPYLESIDTQAALKGALGVAEDDEVVTRQQLEQFATPQPGDTNSLLTFRAAWSDALQQLDPYEEVQEIAVADLQGDPAEMFSKETFRAAIVSMVPKQGVANGLAVKIDAAEAARLIGDEQACHDAIRAFRNQLRAQKGKAITIENARLLDASADVLCPPEANP